MAEDGGDEEQGGRAEEQRGHRAGGGGGVGALEVIHEGPQDGFAGASAQRGPERGDDLRAVGGRRQVPVEADLARDLAVALQPFAHPTGEIIIFCYN